MECPVDLGRMSTLTARGGQVCLGSSWPSTSSPRQGGAEVLRTGQACRTTSTSMPGGRDPQGPGRRAMCFMSLCLTLSVSGRPDRVAHAGAQSSCPSSAPHGPTEKNSGVSHYRRPTRHPGRGATTPQLLWESPGSAMDQKVLLL